MGKIDNFLRCIKHAPMLTHQHAPNEIKSVRPICKDMKKPPFHNESLPTLLTEKV